MAFCSYSKDYSNSSFTSIENQFLNKYMPIADGESVKVYLYGLYLCQNCVDNCSIDNMASILNMQQHQIIDAFKFWEELDLIQITCLNPFTVSYLPADYTKGKPKKFKPEKYTDFNKALQCLRPNSMISPNEYSEYFSIMEQYAIKPEAMLLIVKYCIDSKGEDITYKYISKVATSFASEGITSSEKVEEKLSDYVLKTSDITKVLTALGSRKKPELEDLNLYKHWTDELYFELENIVFTAKKIKGGNMSKLDSVLEELYANKKFESVEIATFLKEKSSIISFTIDIAKALGTFCDRPEEISKEYVSSWLSKGYSNFEILSLAKYYYNRNKKSFLQLNELIEKLYSRGIVSMESIAEYMNKQTENDKFICKILSLLGISRKPNGWDRDSLKTWRSWSFSDEMIEEAAKLSIGKNSPIPYMNAILSSWKSKNIFSIDQIIIEKTPQKTVTYSSTKKVNDFVTTSNNRAYSEEEYEKMVDSWSDIEI